jgi:hypothetical protein
MTNDYVGGGMATLAAGCSQVGVGASLNAMISDVASLLTGTIVALKNSSMYLGTTLGSILYGLCIGSTRSVRLGS